MSYSCNAESSNRYYFETVEDSVMITIESTIGTIRFENDFGDHDDAKAFFCDKVSMHAFENEAYDFENNPFHILSLILHVQQQGGARVILNGRNVVPARMEDTAGWPDVVNEDTLIRLDGVDVPLKTILKIQTNTRKAMSEFELGKYPYVVICKGPWDMPEMNGCGRVVLTDAEYDQQIRNIDAFWKCPVCAYGVFFDDENYAAWCEAERENEENSQEEYHKPGCPCPDCEEQPILGER